MGEQSSNYTIETSEESGVVTVNPLSQGVVTDATLRVVRTNESPDVVVLNPSIDGNVQSQRKTRRRIIAIAVGNLV